MRIAIMSIAALFLLVSCSSDDSGTNSDGSNKAPVAPSNPQPASGTSGVSTATQLTWQCSDPEGDSIIYDVAFGISNPPSVVSNDLATSSYSPGQLTTSSTYYWKVTATDSKGASASGPVWSFTTVGNSAPNMPTMPSPEHLLQGREYTGTSFSWQCSDPDGDSLTYDLYFGSTTTLQQVKSSLPSPEYVANALDWFYTLDYNQTYYWQVVAIDGMGHSTPGPVWSFTTHKEVQLIAKVSNIGTITDIALNGNHVILVDNGSRLLSVDVSNPAAPILVGALNLDVSSVDVFGGFAYASTPGQLEVIDISNPADIRVWSSHSLTDRTRGDAVRVVGTRVFVSCGNYIDVFTILSPSSLVLSGTLSYSDFGDYTVNGDFAVVGSIVYVGAWANVLDITSLSAPTTVITPVPWLHQKRQNNEMQASDGFLYSAWGYYLYALNVSTPRTPLISDSIAFPQGIALSSFAPTSVYSKNGLVYVATKHWVGPLVIYDATDPADIKLYAWYNRNATLGEAVVATDTHAYVAASGQGLLVLRLP